MPGIESHFCNHAIVREAREALSKMLVAHEIAVPCGDGIRVLPAEAGRLWATDEKGCNDREAKRAYGLVPACLKAAATTHVSASGLHTSIIPFVAASGELVLKFSNC